MMNKICATTEFPPNRLNINGFHTRGYICRDSAWKLAYFRGVCSAELEKCSKANAASTMVSIALSEAKATQMVAIANRNARTFGIAIDDITARAMGR
jgi:hypothetical protein